MRKQYITSLKGIACLGVAIGHFLGLIKYSPDIPLNTDWLLTLSKFRLDFLIDEGFWLYLFFIVSGYLVANSKIANYKELLTRIVFRFLRFAIPILAACFIIFSCSKIVPFYNSQTTALFENTWLQSAYPNDFSLLNVLLSPFDVLLLNNIAFNSPYWVLRSMMFASFLIYFITYIKSKNITKKITLPLLVIISVFLMFFDKVIFSCMLGALLCYFEPLMQKILKSKTLVLLSGALSLGICFLSSLLGGIMLFSWLLMATPYLVKFKNILETKPLIFIGEISFGIYSFHWPIYCSLGALCVIKLWNVVGGGWSIAIASILTMIATIVLSIFFYYVVEKNSNKLLNKLKKGLNCLLETTKK